MRTDTGTIAMAESAANALCFSVQPVKNMNRTSTHRRVAQFGRASVSKTEGCGFNSCRACLTFTLNPGA